MSEKLTAIVTVESDLDDARFNHCEVVTLLEAIDTLRGTGEYCDTSDLSLNDAAQIILEANEIVDSEYSMEKIRRGLVERRDHLAEGIRAIEARVERIKAEAYDRAVVWIEKQIKENKHLPHKCRTLRCMRDVLVNDPEEDK